MNPEIHCRLTIHGEFDPQVATDRLGIRPRKTARKGRAWNPRLPTTLAKNDIWSSAWSKGDPISAESYVSDLLDTFWPKRGILKGLKEEFGVGLEVSLAIYIYDDEDVFETPSVHLDGDLLQRVSDLGAEIDIDLYVFRASAEEGESDEK